MKIRLPLMTLALILGVAALAPAAPPSSCETFCFIVSCTPGQVCGPYINQAGQLVCGCHVPGPKG